MNLTFARFEQLEQAYRELGYPAVFGPRQLTAATWDGQTFALSITGKEDGFALLHLLVAQGFQEFEPSRIRLAWDDKDLCDDDNLKTVDEHQIPAGATIMIVKRHESELNLLGGGKAGFANFHEFMV